MPLSGRSVQKGDDHRLTPYSAAVEYIEVRAPDINLFSSLRVSMKHKFVSRSVPYLVCVLADAPEMKARMSWRCPP